MNTDQILVRCSSLHKLLTHFDKPTFEKGHQTLAKEIHRQYKWDRQPDWGSKYTEKGIIGEEDAITLLSLSRKMMLKKNTERITNDYISGHPDVYIGESIDKAEEGFDTKCSWDVHSFPHKSDALDNSYLYQNHGYMYLTGAKKWTTVYCLVNAPIHLITREKETVYYKMGCPDDTNQRYIERLIEIEKNMIFDMKKFLKDNQNPALESLHVWKWDIPQAERIMEFPVMRNEEVYRKIDQRVTLLRGYIQNNNSIKTNSNEKFNV